MAEEFTALGTALIMMVVDFKKMAFEFKKFLGLDLTQAFPALNIAENKLCYADAQFEFCIVADSDWNCKDSVNAYYKHSERRHEIGVRESVYLLALGGDFNALYSIAHEVAHWGLINYFKINFGLPEFERLDPVSKMVILQIHENITDVLTALLVFSEEELLKMDTGDKAGFSSFIGKNQLALAAYYCKHHKLLTENFFKNIAPKIWEQNKIQRRLKNA